VIDAVGVVVPAHNEEARIDACLHSLRAALAQLPRHLRVAVTVVLDRCEDQTPRRVAARLRGWPGTRAVSVPYRVSGRGVGFLRDLGVRDLLRGLRPARPERIWLLSTDADTTVPVSWALEQLRYACAGAHGVAGLAELEGEPRLSTYARARYRSIVAGGIRAGSHDHVYAANLGFRADAYLRCGGFPERGHGEEHDLWKSMAAAGYRLYQPTDLRVRTSARTHGRAEGGLADLLKSLPNAPAQHRDDHSLE
jgi:hypothetical protein